MPQMKELNEMQVSNLPDTKLKTMVIRMLKERRRRIDKHSENLNKEIVNIKKGHRNHKNEPLRNEKYNT